MGPTNDAPDISSSDVICADAITIFQKYSWVAVIKTKMVIVLLPLLNLSYTNNDSPGYSSAEDPKRTQSPVSKLADLQVEFLRQSSMQSVSMRVPGLESSMSSGAV